MTEDKDSWKVRQQAVLDLQTLFEKKAVVQNTPSVHEVLIALKERLNETNLNLRAKVISSIGIVISKLVEGGCQYANAIIPDLIVYAGDSNRSVVDAVFSTLTKWISNSMNSNTIIDISSFSLIMAYIPAGIKTTKGKIGLFRWIKQNANFLDKTMLAPLIHGILDGVLDKSKDCRNLSSDLLEIAIEKCGVEVVKRGTANRKQIDISQLHSIIDALAKNVVNQDNQDHQDHQGHQDFMTKPLEEETKNGEITQRQKEQLAKRKGVRVLGKPKLGPDGKPLSKYPNAKSSIPKPMPRNTKTTTKTNAIANYPINNSTVYSTTSIDLSRIPPAPAINTHPSRLSAISEVTETAEVSRLSHSNEEIPSFSLVAQDKKNKSDMEILEEHLPSPILSVADSLENRENLENLENLENVGKLEKLEKEENQIMIKPVSLGFPLNHQQLLFDEKVEVDGKFYSNSKQSLLGYYFQNTKSVHSFINAIQSKNEALLQEKIEVIIHTCYPVIITNYYNV